MTLNYKNVDRLEDIYEEMKELLFEVERLIVRCAGENSAITQRAKKYWLAHMMVAMDDNHDYLSKNTVTMLSTIEELREELEKKDESR